jgi:glucans biosynthesis protein
MLDRRTLLKLAAATQMFGMFGGASALAAPPAGLRYGEAGPFSYDALKNRARTMAAGPYTPPPRPDPAIVESIDYDAHGKLKYKPDYALYGDGQPGAYPVTFQHVGRFFPKTVKMHAVDPAAGTAREILYDPQYFTVGPDSPAAKLAPEPSAFAGFWIQEAKDKGDWKTEEPWVAFLGASYFRAKGELGQVGLSARGITITPGSGGPEEFPDFIGYWFEPANSDADAVTVYALLDGPSLTGAYRFLMRRTAGVVMDVETTLFLRQPVERLGVAPLTSMFWYSETVKKTAIDWRPEVHDSDGLAMWTGGGEHIWRPLNNPARIVISSFSDQSPKGFGLLQRDRNFDHYQDGVRYHLRPSAWVEPLGDWGRGQVQLVELPTDDEIHDNIVAYWHPEAPTKAGDELPFAYRIHWLADEPYPTDLARVVATRLGRGGQPGQPRPEGVRKFMVEFLGGPLVNLPFGVKPEPVFWASRGTFSSYTLMEAVPDDVPGHWRVQFDLNVDGDDPVEMRLFLKVGDQVASETWLFQYRPFVSDARPVGN